VTGLVLVLVLAAGGAAVLLRAPHHPAASRTRTVGTVSTVGTDGPRAAAAGLLLRELVRRLQRPGSAQVSALAASGAPAPARELTTLQANVRALRITDLSMTYVAEDPARPGTARTSADDTWRGLVRLRWRLRGFGSHDESVPLPVTFHGDGDRLRFVTARDGGHGPVPLWLLGPVRVERGPRSLVVTTPADRPARYARLADRAVHDVRRVLTHWRGRLVVEVPGGRGDLSRVLGSGPDAYDDVAAVTTTGDGSRTPGAAAHVYVNSRVFDPLGPRGSQIVMSHEATHVATGAATSSMPSWLLEGFADYVALDHVPLPASVTASEALALVRAAGAPSHLPGRAAFGTGNRRVGASYESAWLACRLIAQRYGERRLVAFYRAADRDASTTVPFRTVLGTDQRSFTRVWRADLRRLAGSRAPDDP
jgi:hypothetical protein